MKEISSVTSTLYLLEAHIFAGDRNKTIVNYDRPAFGESIVRMQIIILDFKFWKHAFSSQN